MTQPIQCSLSESRFYPDGATAEEVEAQASLPRPNQSIAPPAALAPSHDEGPVGPVAELVKAASTPQPILPPPDEGPSLEVIGASITAAVTCTRAILTRDALSIIACVGSSVTLAARNQ